MSKRAETGLTAAWRGSRSNPRMPVIHAKRSEQFGLLEILGQL